MITCPYDVLDRLAALAPDTMLDKIALHGARGVNLDLFLDWARGKLPRVRREQAWKGGRYLELTACPFESSPHDTPSAFVFASRDGVVAAKCLHDACRAKTWQTLCEHLQVPESLRGSPADQPRARTDRLTTATVIRLVLESGTELFRTPDLELFAAVPVPESKDARAHTEIHALGSSAFAWWVRALCDREVGQIPGAQTVRDAVDQLRAKAMFAGTTEPVYARVAPFTDRTILDLGDSAWRVVEITAGGWTVLDTSPVRFRRHGTYALPVPVAGSGLAALRRLLNFPEKAYDTAWRLALTWLTAALRGEGPFAVLIFEGRPGATKTTAARLMRDSIDPRRGGVRRPSHDERDLLIAAFHSWIFVLDNVGEIRPWLSDLLCGISTGIAVGARRLRTDQDEVTTEAMRPVIVTSIERVAVRGDLVDRSVIIRLPSLPAAVTEGATPRSRGRHRGLVRLRREFQAALPMILGALCDVVSAGLATLPEVPDEGLPRMAEFARWGCAVAQALGWTADQFLDAYGGVRAEGQAGVLEASLITTPLLATVPEGGSWAGTAGELLEVLSSRVSEDTRRHRLWPRTPRGMRAALDQVALELTALGIEITPLKRTEDGRGLLISRAPGGSG